MISRLREKQVPPLRSSRKERANCSGRDDRFLVVTEVGAKTHWSKRDPSLHVATRAGNAVAVSGFVGLARGRFGNRR